MSRNVMTLPLIVIENCTSLDVNDCYFRSIKREKNHNQPKEDFDVEEIGFWVNGDFIYDH